MSANERVRSMGTRVALMGIVAGIISLPSCAFVKDQAQVDPAVASVKRMGGHGQPDAIIPDCRISDWVERASSLADVDISCPPSVGGGEKIDLPNLPTDPLVRRAQAQAELMTYADQICDDHIAGIYAKNASANLTFGLLTTLFSGGAAIASGRAATNLAAGSALFSGSRSLVNSEIYYGYIGPAVMREIRSVRSDLRSQIAVKRSCSVIDYPPQEAINDALTYHDACSFSTGLASLLSKAGTTRVGEDKLRGAQIRMNETQLAEKKTELTALNAQIAALDKGKNSDALTHQVTELRQEIKELERIQRFAAVVDPVTSPARAAVADGLQQQLDRAKAALDQAKETDANAKPAEKTKTSSVRQEAQSKFDALNDKAAEADKIALQVKQAQDDLGSLLRKKNTLDEQWSKLSMDQPVGALPPGRALDPSIADAQKKLVDLEKLQRGAGAPLSSPTASSGTCLPLTLQTMN